MGRRIGEFFAQGLAGLAMTSVLTAADPCGAQSAPNAWWNGYAAAGKLVPLADGRNLYLYCEGAGAPTVMMESGLGDDASSWRKVQDAIAVKSKARVCVYDRAGYGRSTSEPGRRDTETEVGDLEQMLKAAKLPAPYVMVGHSMAGLNLRLFATRHPKQVAGMVLIDAAFPDLTKVMFGVSPNLSKMQSLRTDLYRACVVRPEMAKYCAPYVARPDDVPPALAAQGVGTPSPHALAALSAEQEAFMNDDPQELAGLPPSLGATPLIVLTAGRTWKVNPWPPTEIEAMDKAWLQQHDAMAALSSRGVNRLVEGSGHSIQREQPQVVIDAVDEVVRMVRGG